jgi:ATP-dependent DNA ligase
MKRHFEHSYKFGKEQEIKILPIIEEYFNEMTLQGEEGLVIKNLESVYILGGNATKRLEFWVKMKPEYGDMVRDLDVVILAGNLYNYI